MVFARRKNRIHAQWKERALAYRKLRPWWVAQDTFSGVGGHVHPSGIMGPGHTAGGSTPSTPPSQRKAMPTRVRLLRLKQPNKKIQSIKMLRHVTGYMLKESKNIVDALNPTTPGSAHPIHIDVNRSIDPRTWADFGEWFEYDNLGKSTAGLTEDQQLAILLHNKMCTHNHADMCSWMYRDMDKAETWAQEPHARYLKKARGVLLWVNFQIAKKIVESL